MKFLKRLLLSVLLCMPLLAAVLIVFYRQDIADWFILRNYDPPASIVDLADRTTMTDNGRRLFFVAQPELNDRNTFWQNCTFPEETIVLGCLTKDRRIYIFDVEDERLSGIHEVTAAHEMLHVAYSRLDHNQRAHIDTLTAQVFDELDNERIINTVESYRKRDANQVPDELHSILGTEVMDLPGELEDYYAQYFDDRNVVVRFALDYVQAFEELKKQIDEYDARLETLRPVIDNNLALIEARRRDLELERNRLDRLRREGRIDEYNQSIPGFNSQVSRYNHLVDQTENLIDEHNRIVEARNAIVLEERSLTDAIDSRPETL